MPSSVVAMLFVSHDEALRGGSGRVMALTMFPKTGERERGTTGMAFTEEEVRTSTSGPSALSTTWLAIKAYNR